MGEIPVRWKTSETLSKSFEIFFSKDGLVGGLFFAKLLKKRSSEKSVTSDSQKKTQRVLLLESMQNIYEILT